MAKLCICIKTICYAVLKLIAILIHSNLCSLPGPFSASIFVGCHCLIKMHILLTISYVFLIVPVQRISITL